MESRISECKMKAPCGVIGHRGNAAAVAYSGRGRPVAPQGVFSCAPSSRPAVSVWCPATPSLSIGRGRNRGSDTTPKPRASFGPSPTTSNQAGLYLQNRFPTIQHLNRSGQDIGKTADYAAVGVVFGLSGYRRSESAIVPILRGSRRRCTAHGEIWGQPINPGNRSTLGPGPNAIMFHGCYGLPRTA